MPELIHDLPVKVHLVLQSQTGVLQLVCHLLLLLQGRGEKRNPNNDTSSLMQYNVFVVFF